jgi:hypothetical protein
VASDIVDRGIIMTVVALSSAARPVLSQETGLPFTWTKIR